MDDKKSEAPAQDRTQERLITSEIRYRRLFESAKDGILILNAQSGKIDDVNPFLVDLLGYTRGEFLNKSIWDIGLFKDIISSRENFLELKERKYIRYEDLPLKTADGRQISVEFVSNVYKEDHHDVIQCNIRDITERKRSEKALREYENLLSQSQEIAHVGSWQLDLTSNRLIWTDEVYRIFGCEPQEFASTYEAFLDFVHPDDRAAVKEAYDRSQQEGSDNYEIEHRIIQRNSGEVRHVHERCVHERDDTGTIVQSTGMVHDITERKKAEEAIAAEKESLTVTLRSIGDGVIATDAKGTIKVMNTVAEGLCGWKEDEARGKPLTEVFNIINENTRQTHENPVDKVLESNGVVELSNHTVIIAEDGTERVIADSGAPIRNNENQIIGVVLVFRDITEKEKLLEASQRNQKLESLGLLAGGIAHDFNNLMGGIFGHIDLAMMKLKDEAVVKQLSKVVSTIERARGLTRQLLTFAKGGEPTKSSMSVVELIQDAAHFALSGSKVSCSIDLPEDLWNCNIDKHQISQVIDNLVINAQQAMPTGGTVRISAKNVNVEKEEHTILHKGKYVKISIQDTGIGISKQMLSKIFDPFFTTKQMGHGLGLATCYSIVNRHCGAIDVESVIEEGTTFHVYLPAIEDNLSTVENTETQHSGYGKIIVMDDEEVLRETIASMLEALGYTVDCRNDGKTAIESFIEEYDNKRSVSAMILDLTVPGGMGGKEVAREIRKLEPNIPIFVTSGYANDPIMIKPIEYGFTASISKPFRQSDLSEMLNKYMKPKE